MKDLRSTLYPEVNFGGFSDIDFSVIFFNRVRSLLLPEHTVLDYGCGRGVLQSDPCSYRRDIQILQGSVHKVIGADVDEEAKSNPYIDEFHLLETEKIPLPSRSVDLCICRSVIEHMENPTNFFAEMSRVIKPGGYICLVTPNKYSYFGIASRMIPDRFHAWLLKKIMKSFREDHDVFPTFYNCNSIWKMRKDLSSNDFSNNLVYGYDGEPQYFSFSRILYQLGVLHQKAAPRSMKTIIFAFAKRDDSRIND